MIQLKTKIILYEYCTPVDEFIYFFTGYGLEILKLFVCSRTAQTNVLWIMKARFLIVRERGYK